MSATKTCPQCGGGIPEGSPEGRCPQCMLRAGLGEESEGRPAGDRFEGDRNLLFGVFALQLRKVTPQEVMAAAGAWAADAAKDIPTRLREQNILSQADVEFIARLVDEAVRAHGGDTAATLNTLGGDQILQATYGNSIDLTQHRLGAAAGSPVYLDGAPLDPDSVPGVQETPGRYTHVSEHARGGMGRVLLVHDGFLGRNVALKELMPGQRPTSDPDNPSTPVRQYMGFLSRFLQEARITGQLEHPSIVPVYELGHRQDGTLYYTMKLVRGRTLREAINQSKTIQDRLSLLAHFVDLCQAIAYAHSRGIVHRDIKPDNVMVGEFGETVVLDWGLAKAKDREDCHADGLAETIRMLQLGDVDSALKTQYGQVMGTPGYMSPEQALGRMAEVDEKSDVYSLGAVLYQMLAGRPPFTGKSVPEILQKVVDDEPEALDANTVPPELAAVCTKAMHKRAQDRYTTASEMADEVRRFQTGAIVQAYSYGLAHHIKRFAAKHKAVLTTTAAALLALVALASYSYVNIRRARDVAETKRAEAEAAKAESDKHREAEQDARQLAERNAYIAGIGLAKASLDLHNISSARRQLKGTPAHLRNWEWGYLYNVMDTSLFTLNDVCSAVFSPDGRLILTANTDDTAKVWEAGSGKLLHTLNGGSKVEKTWSYRVPNCASFSSDGSRIAFTSGKNIKVWETKTGNELLTITNDRMNDFVGFSPDGNRIHTYADGQIKIWSSTTGQEILTITTSASRSAEEHGFSADGKRVFARVTDSREIDFIKVWDAASGDEIVANEIPNYLSIAATFSPDRSKVVSNQIGTGLAVANTADECALTIWDAANGSRLLSLAGASTGSYTTVNFNADGTLIVGGGFEAKVSVWDAQSGEEVSNLYGHTDTVNCAKFGPNAKWILTASRDTTSRVWEVTTGKQLLLFSGHADSVKYAAFSPDGGRVLTVSDDYTAKVWDSTLRPVEFADEYLDVFSLNFSPDGRRICGRRIGEHTANVWDSSNGNKLLTLAGHSKEVTLAIFSPDGKHILTGSWDETVRIWDSETGHEQHRLVNPAGVVVKGEFSPDAAHLLTVTSEGSVRIWDVQTGKEMISIAVPTNDVKGYGVIAHFAPNGKQILVFSVAAPNVIKTLDTETGKETLVLRSDGGNFSNACYSRDGAQIIAMRWDSPTVVWDALSGQQLYTLAGHFDGNLTSSDFTRDGTRLCGAVDGKTVKVWNATNGSEILSLAEFRSRVDGAQFSADGKRIVVDTDDASIGLWDASAGEQLFSLHDSNMNNLGDAIVKCSPDGRRILSGAEWYGARIWSAAPWRPEDWLDDAMRTELVRLALRSAPEVHKTTLDRSKNEVEPFLAALDAATSAWSANASGDIQPMASQGVYLHKATATPVPSVPLADEDVIISVDSHPVDTIEALTTAIDQFTAAACSTPSEAHTLRIETVNRYDRDMYAITIPGLSQ